MIARGLTPRAGRRLQAAMALGGFALGTGAVIAALAGEGPPPPWLPRFFAAWCVVTPYWWWLEHRLLYPPDAAAQRHFQAMQALSRQVWLGFAMALGVLLLARSR